MDYVWEIIQPYVMAVIAFLSGGGAIAIILRTMFIKMLNRNSTMLAKTYNVEQICDLVVKRLAGKTMNIDVTAVTERALRKTTQQLDTRIDRAENIANAHTAVLVAIAKGMLRLKALSDEERNELATAVQQLEKGYKLPEVAEVMTVKLEPIELKQDDESEEQDNEDEDGNGVNFGGLNAV